jgi:small subunit ribosomal protein S7
MPRRAQIPKREPLPDPVFQSPLVTRFINNMMMGGKKSTAQSIFYKAMDLVKERANDDPLKVFRKAVDNVKPMLEVKSRRVGGSNYQVPIEVQPNRRNALASRWLSNCSRSRSERSMKERLANEILDAAALRGGAFKKKDDTHRMAEANKAFAHYRW